MYLPLKKSRFVLLIGVLIVGVVVVVFVSSRNSDAGRVCFEKKCFTVDIVSSDEDRARGLMYRQDLSTDAGMLFVFPRTAIYPFWMKNTLIPLDIIWIGEDRTVVSVRENVPPCSSDPCPMHTPDRGALWVLELAGGTADVFGIRVGDKAELP